MPDSDYLLSATSGGLRGLIDAYKMKMEADQEASKVRQSGFNALGRPGADSLDMARLQELIRHNKAMEGKPAGGGIAGSTVNRLLGKDLFAPEENVSSGERILAAENVRREQALAGARGQYQQIKDAADFLSGMQSDFNSMAAAGQTGPVSGRFHSAIAKLTSGKVYPKTASYLRRKEGLVGRLKSVAGEAGRITDEDVKRMGVLISGVESGTVAANDAYAEINKILTQGRKNIETVYPGVVRQMGGTTMGAAPGHAASGGTQSLLDMYGAP